MPASDPNDSTWYVLRYPADWGDDADPDGPFRAESAPWLSSTLFHDELRHVTELRPADPEVDALPIPGIAVEPGGDSFRVDPKGKLVKRRCDGSEVAFPCEPDLVRRPAGLAIDRRGWLYVADPGARRVVVIDVRSQSAVDVLSAGTEPVDVAVSAAGRVAVADRSGLVHLFTSGRRPVASFAPRNVEGLPLVPHPIAVMYDDEDRLLVADARHPRLLRFHADGTPDADVELSSLAAGLAAIDLDALQDLYGPVRPVFVAGPGCDCPPSDGPARLAAVHLALRVVRLALGRTWTTEGVYVSRRLDGGAPGTEWHQVVVDADLPEGTSLVVETATSEHPTTAPTSWDAPRDALGDPVPFAADLPDQLVQSGAGRYLWVRATLRSDGKATPSIRAIRAYYPRNSPLALLPAHWQRDPDARAFLQRFLALVERVNTGVEARYEQFLRDLNPDAVSDGWVDWLGALIDLTFDPSWPLERRRALLAAAMELYRRRGTPEGLRRYVEIYTGTSPVVLESFLGRPARSGYLGVPGTVLGCNVQLCSCKPDETPDAELYARYAHRFTVVAPVASDCDVTVTRSVVERIVEVNKPAHTVHAVELALPDARVGLQARVGVDLVLGGPTPAAMRTVPEPGSPVDGATLGVDSVLGDRGTGASGGRGILEL